jgi:hypothetical protein
MNYFMIVMKILGLGPPPSPPLCPVHFLHRFDEDASRLGILMDGPPEEANDRRP